MKIRKMVIADFDEVVALWRKTRGIGLHDDVDSREGIKRYLRRNPGLSFVARQGPQLLGAVLCGHDGRRGYLHHLAVAENARGQGVGRTLVERALSALRKIGIGKCHIFVFAGNHSGRAFWKKIKWTRRTDLEIMSCNTECRRQERIIGTKQEGQRV